MKQMIIKLAIASFILTSNFTLWAQESEVYEYATLLCPLGAQKVYVFISPDSVVRYEVEAEPIPGVQEFRNGWSVAAMESINLTNLQINRWSKNGWEPYQINYTPVILMQMVLFRRLVPSR